MRKKQRVSKTPSNIVLLITVTVILVLGYQSIKMVHISRNLDQQIIESKAAISVEEEKLEKLQKQRKEMDSLEQIEKVAREKLGLIKKDEIIFKEKP